MPVGLCFSTVGRLWYLPGALLLAAVAVTVTAGGIRELAAVIRANWLPRLVSVLGAFELLMAVTASSATTAATGIVGGVSLVVAPWLTSRSRTAALALLLVGTLPFTVLTWWSVATPLLAVLALAVGLPTVRSQATAVDRAGHPAAG